MRRQKVWQSPKYKKRQYTFSREILIHIHCNCRLFATVKLHNFLLSQFLFHNFSALLFSFEIISITTLHCREKCFLCAIQVGHLSWFFMFCYFLGVFLIFQFYIFIASSVHTLSSSTPITIMQLCCVSFLIAITKESK
jgi:hypothetical protein